MAARRRTPTKRKPSKRATAPRTARRRKAKVPIDVPEGWTVDQGGKSISLQLKTPDFLDALSLMNEIGQVAEELEHHPDLHLEKWNHLRITTYSHDVGRLTDRDERLAQRITELVAKLGYPTG